LVGTGAFVDEFGDVLFVALTVTVSVAQVRMTGVLPAVAHCAQALEFADNAAMKSAVAVTQASHRHCSPLLLNAPNSLA